MKLQRCNECRFCDEEGICTNLEAESFLSPVTHEFEYQEYPGAAYQKEFGYCVACELGERREDDGKGTDCPALG